MTDHLGSYGSYVDGEWVDGDGTFEVLDPATNEPVATVADGSPDEVDAAVAAARDALEEWRAVPPAERGRKLRALADLLRERAEELARVETLENGRPVGFSTMLADAGNFYAPTVLADVDDDAPVACEEVFGPVLAVQSFGSGDEVLGRANDTDYGLYSVVWTTDLSRAHRVGRRLETGTVAVNEFPATFPQAPFGGFDESGLGREHGTEAVHEYTRVKNYVVNLEDGA